MVRTRVAPSPTGDPHLGTAYSALMNYCYAHRHGGQFILRIEDTDRTRSTPQSEAMILDSLRWLGLDWSEGPDVGGPNGPYRQSERGHLYAPHVASLLERGHAFRCFCTPDRLAAMRSAQSGQSQRTAYDGHCLSIPPAEAAARAAAGEAHVIRMKVPDSGDCTIWDMRRGPVTIGWSSIDMQVLVKSDGMPTYHLANVVDDHLMGITHVLRGEEWLPSAPKHLLLYDYLGWEAPKLCHLPLLRNPDRSKLSKRRNPTSLSYYRRAGFLPEALANMLGLFALSVTDGDELFSLDDIVAGFHVNHIALGGPVFDLEKLAWLNGRHLRERLTAEQFVQRVADWALRPETVRPALELARSRVEKLADLAPLLGFLFTDRVEVPSAPLAALKLDADAQRKALQLALWSFDALTEWTAPAVEAALREISAVLGKRFSDFIRLFYLAVSGSPKSIPVIQAMEILGRDLTRERLRHLLQHLGGTTAAEAAAWRGSLPSSTP